MPLETFRSQTCFLLFKVEMRINHKPFILKSDLLDMHLVFFKKLLRVLFQIWWLVQPPKSSVLMFYVTVTDVTQRLGNQSMYYSSSTNPENPRKSWLKGAPGDLDKSVSSVKRVGLMPRFTLVFCRLCCSIKGSFSILLMRMQLVYFWCFSPLKPELLHSSFRVSQFSSSLPRQILSSTCSSFNLQNL